MTSPVARRCSLAVVSVALLAAGVPACGTASRYLTPSESTTTLMSGWEHWFTVDSSVELEPDATDPWLSEHSVDDSQATPASHVRHVAHAQDRAQLLRGDCHRSWRRPGARRRLGN